MNRGTRDLIATLALCLAGTALADDPPGGREAKTETPESEVARAAEEAAAAEDANPFPLLDEIVVTTKSGGVPLTYGHGRDVVDRDTLQTYPQGAITETLRHVPGVFVQSDAGNDVKMSIGIRGQEARVSPFTAILVDGIPVKQTLYGVVDLDILPFTFERLDRVDVIRGGADLRYGPNAYGGVINFVTRPISADPTLRTRFSFGSDGEYSRMTELGGTFGPLGLMATGVVKGGDGWRDNSRYRQEDGALKFSYAFDEANSISGSVNRFVETVDFASGLTRKEFEDDPEQSRARDFGRGDVDRYNIQLIHRFDEETALEIVAWYHRSFREFSLGRPNLPPFSIQNHQPANYRHRGLEARLSWNTDIAGLRNAFHHSIRWYGDDANRFNYTVPYAQEGFGPHTVVSDADFTTRSFAIYSEDVVSLTDTVDLTLGLRHEDILMAVDNLVTGAQADSDFAVTLPMAGLSWRPLPKSAVFTSWSEGFGTPLYTTMDPSSSSYNPNLEPEDAENYEVGFRTRELDGLDASLTWFRQTYENKIERTRTPQGTTLFFNTAESHAQGVEFGASYALGAAVEELEGFSVHWNFTRQESEIDRGSNTTGDDLSGKRVPNAPRNLTNMGLSYRHSSGFFARVNRSHSGGYYSDALNSKIESADGRDGPVPAFTLWDASIGWDQNPDGEGFSIAVGVTNLLDDDEWFRRNITGIHPGAPRRFNVTAGYTLRF